MIKRILVILTLLLPVGAFAVQPDEILDDPALEKRARAISQDLRCLVCQNENIDDSNASLARDLRLIVRERLVAGDTDDQVKDFIVERYGEFALLKPKIGGSNLALWASGPILLLIALVLGLSYIRKRSQVVENTVNPLSSDEEKRLAEILDQD